MVSKFRNLIASKVRQQMMAYCCLNQGSKSVIKNRVQSIKQVKNYDLSFLIIRQNKKDFSCVVFTHAYFQKVVQMSSLCNFYFY